VIEQVADGDQFAVRGKFREKIGEVIVVVQLAIVYQQHDARSGELLGERCQPEVGLGVNWMPGAEVGDSVSAAKDGFAVALYKNGCAGGIVGFQRLEYGVDLAGGNLGGSRGEKDDTRSQESKREPRFHW
jgi:hypothetical protein